MPGPHLDEHDIGPVLCNEVYFATARSDVPGNDDHTFGLKPVRRHPLAEIPERLSRRHHLNAYWATGA